MLTDNLRRERDYTLAIIIIFQSTVSPSIKVITTVMTPTFKAKETVAKKVTFEEVVDYHSHKQPASEN